MDSGQVGVRARGAKGIEIDFYYLGQRCRETVKILPTKANMRFAQRKRITSYFAQRDRLFRSIVTAA